MKAWPKGINRNVYASHVWKGSWFFTSFSREKPFLIGLNDEKNNGLTHAVDLNSVCV